MRSADLFERGAEGEAATARALAALPRSSGPCSMTCIGRDGSSRTLTTSSSGPAGIFVIDSKNWSGRVDVRDSVLRQNGYQRETTVASAAEAAIAVSLVMPGLAQQLAVPVLCFVREDPIYGWARDVMVCSTSNIAAMLMSRPEVLDEQTRARVCLGLDMSLSAARIRPSSRPTADDSWRHWRHWRRHPRPSAAQRPSRGSRVTRRKRSTRSTGWGRLLVGGVLLATLLAAPQVVTGGAQVVGQFLTGLITPEAPVPGHG